MLGRMRQGLGHPWAGRFLRLVAFSCAATWVALAGPAQATDWKQGKLGHLSQHIGTYDYGAILGDPAVRSALQDLAGSDVENIVINLDVASSIAFIDGHLVLRGNAPHQGGLEEALVMVNVYNGQVRAALLHDNRMTLFAADTEYEYVPRELRDFLRPRTDYARPVLPHNVEWAGRPKN
jgi:hypothetical protein